MIQETSREAYEAGKPTFESKELQVLDHIQWMDEVGATCDEIEKALGMLHTTASARITKLKDDGRIVDSIKRRKTRSGRNAIVWVITNGR